MINPINHYALTSGQPGVINEEAYTVLELVGQVGAKTNECVAQVNENTQETGEFDGRITTAQEAADAAQEAADAAQEAADAAQRTANAATETAQAAMRYVDNVTIFQSVPWWADGEIESGGQLSLGFIEFIKNVVSQILNNNRKYYDLTSIGPGSGCNVVKIKGYCPTTLIDDAENCAGLVDIELDVFKPVSQLANASILVHYKQQVASGSGAYGSGSVFDVVTTITIPAEEYSGTNPYDPDEFFMNRLCTFNVYDFQL
jgi:hypothetical protein